MSTPLLIDKATLSLNTAKQIAAAAAESAHASDLRVVIAIVDDGGNLLYLERMDGAIVGSVEIASRKARGAAHFKTETKNFETGLAAGTMGLLTIDVVGFAGGVPVLSGNRVVGAIGVSGGSAEQDDAVARAGAAALSTVS